MKLYIVSRVEHFDAFFAWHLFACFYFDGETRLCQCCELPAAVPAEKARKEKAPLDPPQHLCILRVDPLQASQLRQKFQ